MELSGSLAGHWWFTAIWICQCFWTCRAAPAEPLQLNQSVDGFTTGTQTSQQQLDKNGTHSVGAGCDLSHRGLKELLHMAKTFYKDGIFTLEDQERVERTLSAPQELMSICPVAYLQACLLKLEENIVYDAASYDNIMDVYVELLHKSLETGNMTPNDASMWPLSTGIRRVKALRKAVQFRRNLTSAMVLNFCRLSDRFGRVHALEWVLEPPFGVKASPSASRGVWGVVPGMLQQTDLYLYLVNADHCVPPEESLLRRLRRATKSVHVIPYRGGPRREEQSAYFKFIVDHYDHLPDYTIFVHPDSPEHQGAAFIAMSKALRLMRTGSRLAEESLQYFPISLQMVVDPLRTWGEEFAPHWHITWDRLFDGDWPYGNEPPQCQWEVQDSTSIRGYAQGSEAIEQGREDAKATCIALGDACFGITCDTGWNALQQAEASDEVPDDPLLLLPRRLLETKCTARRGARRRADLFESPTELSFVKNCSKVVDTAGQTEEQEAEAREPKSAVGGGGDGTSASQFRWRPPLYVEVPSTYLPGYAMDDTTAHSELAVAKENCDRLGDACAGVTCQDAPDQSPSGYICTCRAGRTAVPSGAEAVAAGERSYKKVARTPMAAQSLPPGATPRFQSYMGSHAIVHKDRIRLRSKEEYADLASDLLFCSDRTGQMEALWHSFFGEPLSQWPREKDPRLPLYLKWGVQTLYHYGNEGVI